MPTIVQNQRVWNSDFDWRQQGEEWSSAWGGSEAQWFGTIYPRIHTFVPTGTILEIAPGYGRWTTFLKEYCEHLVVIDLAEKCIEVCRRRFGHDSHITYYVNDGKSLAMIQDNSIDFTFSFDSLVHAEADVIEEYLKQLAIKLKPNGIGFIHHSNIARYQEALSVIDKIPGELRELVVNRVFLGPTHWRDASMSANLFEDYCNKANLQCISQELVNWGTDGLLIDCFSLFTPKNSIWARPNKVTENTDFMNEAYLTRRLSHIYTVKSFRSNGESNNQDENNYLGQQVTMMGKTWRELLVAVQMWMEQYQEREAFLSDQMALMQTRERQLTVLTTQFQKVQQALDIVQRTRVYRLLRQLGRWKFIERTLPQSSSSFSPLAQTERAALSAPCPVECQHLTPLVTELTAISPPPKEGQSYQQSKFEACYAKVREPKICSGVDYLHGAEDRIVQRLRGLGIDVYDYKIDVTDYHRYFSAARYLQDFPNYYPFILPEKSLEHYVAAKLLQLREDDIYIDIASENSPVPEIYRRLFRTRVYRQDIAYPSGLNGDMIGGNAANIPVPNEFATKMALHCSFEHFEGESDIGFIRETIRILQPGGIVCIIPLYLFEEYAIQTDPEVAIPAGVTFENDAVVYCAQGWNNRYGRFYDPDHLVSRVCDNLGYLRVEIYRLVDFKKVDNSCYARFAMLIKKERI